MSVKATLWLPDLEGAPRRRLEPPSRGESLLNPDSENLSKKRRAEEINFSSFLPPRDMVVQRNGETGAVALEQTTILGGSVVALPTGSNQTTQPPPQRQTSPTNATTTSSAPLAIPTEARHPTGGRKRVRQARATLVKIPEGAVVQGGWKRRAAITSQTQNAPALLRVPDEGAAATPIPSRPTIRQAKAKLVEIPEGAVVKGGWKRRHALAFENPVLTPSLLSVPNEGVASSPIPSRSTDAELARQRTEQRGIDLEKRRRIGLEESKQKRRDIKSEAKKLSRERRSQEAEVENKANLVRQREKEAIAISVEKNQATRLKKPVPTPTPLPIPETSETLKKPVPARPGRVPIKTGLSRDVLSKAKAKQLTTNYAPVIKNVPKRTDVQWQLPSGDAPVTQRLEPSFVEPARLDFTLSSLGAPPVTQNPRLRGETPFELQGAPLSYGIPNQTAGNQPSILPALSEPSGLGWAASEEPVERSRRTRERAFVHPGRGGEPVKKTKSNPKRASSYREQNFVQPSDTAVGITQPPTTAKPQPGPLVRQSEIVWTGEPLGDLRRPALQKRRVVEVPPSKVAEAKAEKGKEKETKEKPKPQEIEEEEEERVLTLKPWTQKPYEPQYDWTQPHRTPGSFNAWEQGRRATPLRTPPEKPTVGKRLEKQQQAKRGVKPKPVQNPFLFSTGLSEPVRLVSSDPLALSYAPPQPTRAENWRERFERLDRENPTVAYYETTEKKKKVKVQKKIAKRKAHPNRTIIVSGRTAAAKETGVGVSSGKGLATLARESRRYIRRAPTIQQREMNYAAIAAPEIGAKTHAPERSAPRSAPRDKAPQQPLQDPPGPPLDDGAARRLLEPTPEKERDKMHGELSGEGELYRRKLILKLRSYGTSFPDVCGDVLKDKALESMDTRQLEVLLNEVKFTVGAKTSQIVTGAFSAQMLTLPQYLLAENTPLYVEGPALQLTNLSQSKDYQDLVKELTLEYADWVYQKPENRFLAYMANSIMTIHNINSQAIERGQPDPKMTRKRKRVEEYEKAHEEKEEKEPEKKMPKVEGVEVVEIPAETPVAVAKAAEASPKPAPPRDEFGYELPKGAAPPKPKPKPAPTPATGGRPK